MGKKDTSQFLIIRLSDRQYAINLDYAVEIINPRKAGAASNSMQTLPRDFEYDNVRIPIIDLWRHLQNREHASLADTIMVVTECGGEKAALVVDSADEILRLDQSEYTEIKRATSESTKDLIESHLNTDDRNIPVINLSGIYKLSGVII